MSLRIGKKLRSFEIGLAGGRDPSTVRSLANGSAFGLRLISPKSTPHSDLGFMQERLRAGVGRRLGAAGPVVLS
jgi:hypothetical protein